MRGAFQLAKILGIPVRIHWTFGLILVWIFYVVFQRTGTFHWSLIAWQTLFVLTLFACVVFHEFGHALTARRYGIKTLDIILSPIGGVARLNRMPEKPIQEFWVAIAGPLVNLAIILLLLLFYFFTVSSEKFNLLFDIPQLLIYPETNVFLLNLDEFDKFVIGLMGINAVLAIFNLLPAFPLDGGRILRALLSIKIGRLKATRVSAYIGQILAVALVAIGIYRFDFILAFIGIFVFSTAENEFKAVRFESILSSLFVKDLIRTNFITFFSNESISSVHENYKNGFERNILVLDPTSNKLAGYMSEGKLNRAFQALEKGTPVQSVAEIMEPMRGKTSPEESLKEAYMKMQIANAPILPVFEGEQLIGVLDLSIINTHLNNLKRK